MLDDDVFEGVPIMERLKHKGKLIQSADTLWTSLSGNAQIYPRGYKKKISKALMKDIYKGIKIIDKKNPVYAEMPKIVPVGNGQVKQVYDGQKKEDVNEILITNPNVPLIEDETQ